jgi:UDP-N-acetylmuramate dehydrogenase
MFKIIDFKRYSSINIGSEHKVKVINEIQNYDNYHIIGRGNNILLSDTPPPLAILGDKFDYIIEKNNKLVVGAATSSGKLLTFCKKHDIANFEFLAKLPGNIGGLTKMNAGLKQWEIFNQINCIKTLDGIILKENIEHSYRKTNIDGIIYEVTFNIQKGYNKENQKKFTQMRDNQPNLPSAGSCFKNPKEYSAGYLIEHVDLKGYTIGGMAFSSLHANFLVNIGAGTFDEATKLIKLAQDKVRNKFNIELELEVIIL